MAKKVIDVPDNTVKMHVTFFNEGYGVQDTMIGVGILDDAPTVAENATVEKRVIELPANLINLLIEHKAKHPDYLISFLKDLDYSLELSVREEIGESFYNDIASWYLGYVDLVPEPKDYYVQTDLGIVVNNEYNEGNVNLLNYDVPKDKVVMDENEADEFVKKLAALNARKVKVEE